MRVLSVLFVLALLTALVAGAAPKQQYTVKFDNINIDQILGNKRLFDTYFKCLLDKGPCTPEGAELKKHIPDALATNCAKCSDKQKAGIEKVLRFLYEKHQKEFAELEKKYDPQHKHRQRLREEAKKRGIVV